MARERSQSLPPADDPLTPGSLTLAARLFVAHWQPNAGYMPEGVAEQCIDAAEAFERVQRERAGQIAETV